MNITATLINLYHVCHRELWLHANGIRMEQTSEAVAEGKFIGETTYQERAEKYTQVEIDGIKIDYYDARNGVVHETKKSDKMETAHEAQVKYYLFVLERNGISARYGILEYPRQRTTTKVELTDEDRKNILIWEAEISKIINHTDCPPTINKPVCRQCSYADFCYVKD